MKLAMVEVYTELHTCRLLTTQCCNSVHAGCVAEGAYQCVNFVGLQILYQYYTQFSAVGRGGVRCCTIGGVPLFISGCPGWVTVVGDVRFEVLAHLNDVHHSRKRAVQCE